MFVLESVLRGDTVLKDDLYGSIEDITK